MNAKSTVETHNDSLPQTNEVYDRKVLAKWEPYNPGMSEKAWEKLHALVARLLIKYQDRLIEDQRKGA